MKTKIRTDHDLRADCKAPTHALIVSAAQPDKQVPLRFVQGWHSKILPNGCDRTGYIQETEQPLFILGDRIVLFFNRETRVLNRVDCISRERVKGIGCVS